MILFRKKLLIASLFILAVNQEGSSQFSVAPTKNVIGLESGMFHRGLVGISYQRLFLDSERWLLSAGAGLGIGHIFGTSSANQFYHLNFTTGLGVFDGKTQFYFNLGLELKYIDYYDYNFNEKSNSYFVEYYNGFGTSPIFGLTVVESTYFIQMRYSPLTVFENNKLKVLYPGVGLTAGMFF